MGGRTTRWRRSERGDGEADGVQDGGVVGIDAERGADLRRTRVRARRHTAWRTEAWRYDVSWRMSASSASRRSCRAGRRSMRRMAPPQRGHGHDDRGGAEGGGSGGGADGAARA
jgi:hypothetical protein